MFKSKKCLYMVFFLLMSSVWAQGINRPQEPIGPYPYCAEEVSFNNACAGGIRLSGTLTLPKAKGPFPAVILVHGSGPWDRDECIYNHKIFLVLADHLTKQGIAVLRYDKRGIGKSEGSFDLVTSKDLADDALAAVAYLKTRKDIDINHMGLIGHSEGGMIAAMVIAKSKDLAFMVSLAGPGVNGEKIWLEQGILLQRASLVKEELIQLDSQLRKKIVRIVKNESNRCVIEKKIDALVNCILSTLPKDQREWMEVHSVAEKSKRAFFCSPWFKYFITFEPNSVLKQVRIPALVVFGDLDLVVSPNQNIPPIEKALKASGNKDYMIVTLPKINHLLQNCQLGTEAEISQIEETIAPSLSKIVSDWILIKTKK